MNSSRFQYNRNDLPTRNGRKLRCLQIERHMQLQSYQTVPPPYNGNGATSTSAWWMPLDGEESNFWGGSVEAAATHVRGTPPLQKYLTAPLLDCRGQRQRCPDTTY